VFLINEDLEVTACILYFDTSQIKI